MAAPAIGRRVGWAPGPNAKVDWSHPLAAGLLGLAAGHRVHVGTTPGRIPFATSFRPSSSMWGPGWHVPADTPAIALCPFPAQDDTSCFTLAFAGQWISDNIPVIGYRGGGSPGLSFIKLQNNNRISYRSNGNDRSIAAGSSSARTVVGVKNGLTLTLYVEGKQTATATYTTGQLSVNAATCYYGGDEFGELKGSVALMSSVPWTATQAAQFSIDPFCMLTH